MLDELPRMMGFGRRRTDKEIAEIGGLLVGRQKHNWRNKGLTESR